MKISGKIRAIKISNGEILYCFVDFPLDLYKLPYKLGLRVYNGLRINQLVCVSSLLKNIPKRRKGDGLVFFGLGLYNLGRYSFFIFSSKHINNLCSNMDNIVDLPELVPEDLFKKLRANFRYYSSLVRKKMLNPNYPNYCVSTADIVRVELLYYILTELFEDNILTKERKIDLKKLMDTFRKEIFINKSSLGDLKIL